MNMKKTGGLQIRSNTYSEGCRGGLVSGGGNAVTPPSGVPSTILESTLLPATMTTSKKEKKLKTKSKSLTSSIGG